MEREIIKNQLVDIICKEFQSIWLVRYDNMTLEIYSSDSKKIILDSVDTALKMKDYEEARLWYINNHVVESSREKLIDQTSMDYVLSRLENDKSFFVEYSRFNDGEINYNQICYDKIVNPENGNIEYVVMGFRNIDISKKSEIDDLTGLLIRQVFFSKAEEMIKNNPDKQYDIIISDIVDFKKINETYGPKVADDILRWQGKYLSSFVGEDLIVGRYGGDQMVMFGTREKMMSNTSLQTKSKFDGNIKDSNLPTIVIKFGVYLDVKKDSIIASCDKAHMALNSIKRHYNKTIAYYNDEIKFQLDKQRRIEDSMHLSLKNGDFKVYYQPKHDSKTGELVGAEALVRWIHPEYGFMSPAEFIPLFEQNGFIVEVDHFVWKKTCRNLKNWAERGIKIVPISVNSSKLTMLGSELVNVMKKSVDENGLDPSHLHIEITETLMTEKTADLVKRLNEIRSLGFKVELDDFGSGYSSLNVLSTLPIDIVKLDMSFMQQFGDEKRKKVLVACINLAKDLGFSTVSEGVEFKEQQELLGELDVDMIQGYYYSKPLPENEFEVYMMAHLS